jgi:uncharacterized protein (DUF2164 family)
MIDEFISRLNEQFGNDYDIEVKGFQGEYLIEINEQSYTKAIIQFDFGSNGFGLSFPDYNQSVHFPHETYATEEEIIERLKEIL